MHGLKNKILHCRGTLTYNGFVRGDDDHRADGFGSRLPIVQRFVLKC